MVKCLRYMAAYGPAHQTKCQKWFPSTVVFFFCWLSSLSVWLYWVNQTDRLPPPVPDEVRTQTAVHSCESTHHWRENWRKNELFSLKQCQIPMHIPHKKSIHYPAEKTSTKCNAVPDWLCFSAILIWFWMIWILFD